MATPPPNYPLPEYFLIQLNRQGEVHYVFTEIVASFNAARLGANSALLEGLMRDRSGLDGKRGLKLDAATLPEPGDYTDEWSYFSTKRQSGKKGQTSGP